MDKQLIDLIKFVKDNGLDNDPRIAALLCSLARKPDSNYQKLLLTFLSPKILENTLLGNPFTPYPLPEELQGEIEVGLAGIHKPYQRGQGSNPGTVKFKTDLLTRHMLVAGATGQGKTVAAYNLIFEFVKQGLNFVSLSFKRDIRHLINHIPNLLIFRISDNSNFKWNIFKGNINLLTIVCRVFAETLSLGIGAESMLYQFVSRLHRQERLTIENLYDAISKAKFKVFRDVNWKSSLVNRLLPFKDIFWKILNTEAKMPLMELQQKYSIDFELDQAGEYKSFWGTLIPISFYDYRILNNLRGNKLIIPFLVDEALSIASKEIQHSGYLGDPSFFQLVRLAREFGIGFCFMTSQPYSVSDTIKANSVIKVLMNLGRFEEILDLGRSMNLNKEQLEFVSKLVPGQGIMKIENLKPFPVTFPNVEIDKNVTDEEIDEHNSKLLKGTEFEYLIKPEPVMMQKPEVEEEITQKEKALLTDIYNRPYLSISERMRSINP